MQAMADRHRLVTRAAPKDDQYPSGPPPEPSEPSEFLINPRETLLPSSLTPTTTTVEVILSSTSGLHTTHQGVTFIPTLPQDGPATPTPMVVPTSAPNLHVHRLRPSPSSPSITTILHLAALASSLVDQAATTTDAPTPTHAIPTAPIEVKLGKQPYTLTTITRPHNITFALPTKKVYVNPHWPQVGTIVAESDIPERWRETYEMKAQRQQYMALGVICGVFVLGVSGVLAVGWWKCWWNGECVRSQRKNGKNKKRFDWYG